MENLIYKDKTIKFRDQLYELISADPIDNNSLHLNIRYNDHYGAICFIVSETLINGKKSNSCNDFIKKLEL